ncbi:MAG TPA: hypothetical protein VFJ85_13980 [Acidimicrobiales bacterium]|nr:hypothetical protein [Acidimicrobiales bacterium]
MPRPAEPAFHAVAWLVWALSAAACVELAPSPLYVALVGAVAFLVVSTHGLDTPVARSFPVLVAVGAFFAVVRVVLTAATTHTGGPALFGLPDATLPALLGGFRVGGPVETAVVLQAAAESFAVVGVLAVFGAFNAVVSHHELVQSAPRAFYEPGLVVTVAVAFVPSTVATVARVREADRARTGGRVVRRGRLLRLAVPILESGLERALLLAESMDARGFAAGTPTGADRLTAWCVLGGLAAMGGAFVALVARARLTALALLIAGVVAVVAAVAAASRRVARARYRPRRMAAPDWALAGVSVLAPLGLAALALAGDRSLTWATTTPLRVPLFHPAAALALVALTAPAWRLPAPAPRRALEARMTGPGGRSMGDSPVRQPEGRVRR